MTDTHPSTATLDRLWLTVTSLLDEARAGAPAGAWPTVRLFPSPLRADVVFHDRRGQAIATFRGDGTPALAEALAVFLLDALSRLSAATRARVTALLGAEAGELLVVLTPESGAAHVLLNTFTADKPEHLASVVIAGPVH